VFNQYMSGNLATCCWLFELPKKDGSNTDLASRTALQGSPRGARGKYESAKIADIESPRPRPVGNYQI
jgi:hypothetical protein